ncbi:hypothetical protein HDU97_000846 [Phlyctochytrium planicorne]|nr:hypothetical protein HDU97_000846 [Phlyctochytrium planicorne]
MSSITGRSFRLALLQLKVTANKEANLENARKCVLQAAKEGKANVVVLPECFNSPYGTSYFPEYAEPLEGGPTSTALSAMAKDAGVYLIGGSFPESSAVSSKPTFYNTCTIWDKEGTRIGVHRKVHLFDIDVPGKIRFKESEVLSAGSSLTVVQTTYGAIGVGICYDIRFPEMAIIAARKGCVAMIYPGAFNMTTGPLHWELLQRARALDNQMYVAACSPARDTTASYVAWGHSSVVEPMGEVIAKAGADQEIIYADVDPVKLEETRKAIPIYSQRRFDVYPDPRDQCYANNVKRTEAASMYPTLSGMPCPKKEFKKFFSLPSSLMLIIVKILRTHRSRELAGTTIASLSGVAGQIAGRSGALEAALTCRSILGNKETLRRTLTSSIKQSVKTTIHPPKHQVSPKSAPTVQKHSPARMSKPVGVKVGGLGLERSQADAKLKAHERTVVILNQSRQSPSMTVSALDRGSFQEGGMKDGERNDLEQVWDGKEGALGQDQPLVVRFDVGHVASNDPTEDAHCQVSLGHGRLMFGVFDGHNGPECAQILSVLLPSYISHALSLIPPRSDSGDNASRQLMIERAIKSAFCRLDDDITNGGVLMDPRSHPGQRQHHPTALVWKSPALLFTGSNSSPSLKEADTLSTRQREALTRRILSPAISGACALVAILDGLDLYVACTGDSRAVLGRVSTSHGKTATGIANATHVHASGGGSRRHHVPIKVSSPSVTSPTSASVSKSRLHTTSSPRASTTPGIENPPIHGPETVFEAVELSIDQTGSNLDEQARLAHEHPGEEETVVMRGRLLGYLMPSRAFGDAIFKWPVALQKRLLPYLMDRSETLPNYISPPYLTAEPVITRYRLDPTRDRFLVLATDGLFDELESEEVVDIVAGYLAQNGILSSHNTSLSELQAEKPSTSIQGASSFEYQRWAQVDENVATSLIRNALGGRDEDRLGRILAIPAPYSRRFRDDITVNVVFFGDLLSSASLVDRLQSPDPALTTLQQVVLGESDQSKPPLPEADVALADLKPDRIHDILSYLSKSSSAKL